MGISERRLRRFAGPCGETEAAAIAHDAPPAHAQILIVEDDRGSRRALVNVLEDRGYTVAGVGTAGEALDFLDRSPLPQLIILDLMLPDMEGWDFRHRQKKTPAIANIPVIGVSAVGKLVDVEYSFRKPLDYDDFIHAVEHYLGQPEGSRNRSRRL